MIGLTLENDCFIIHHREIWWTGNRFIIQTDSWFRYYNFLWELNSFGSQLLLVQLSSVSLFWNLNSYNTASSTLPKNLSRICREGNISLGQWILLIQYLYFCMISWHPKLHIMIILRRFGKFYLSKMSNKIGIIKSIFKY